MQLKFGMQTEVIHYAGFIIVSKFESTAKLVEFDGVIIIKTTKIRNCQFLGSK